MSYLKNRLFSQNAGTVRNLLRTVDEIEDVECWPMHVYYWLISFVRIFVRMILTTPNLSLPKKSFAEINPCYCATYDIYLFSQL